MSTALSNCKFIKVCGMRQSDNIHAVEALGIHLMGFIFWPQSSRYVSQRPDYLPTRCKRVGVFVNAEPTDVLRHAVDYGLDYLQLHGQERPDYIRRLRAACDDKGLTTAIIKAFNIATPSDLQTTESYQGLTDLFLFDTKAQLAGGNGKKFDWSILDAYHGSTPFLLSGGIGPDDAEALRSFHHPQFIGIDLNSRFEVAPAVKNIQKLKSFLSQL